MYVLATRGKNMQFVYCSKYLTMEMPNMRSRAIRHICLMDDDNPYWDSIDKYFARPLNPLFQQIINLDYFRLQYLYEIH